MLKNQKENPEHYDIIKETEAFKQEINGIYELWGKAFSINKAYRLCYEDKTILSFSHRICGWSNPVHQLTPNFSFEIKTNFGYGSASYFYTKLKYKNIEITPFSDWITYQVADFSEIIRYTQSYNLENHYWLDAMTYSKEACNLSKTDEEKFVKKYIIDECEKMVAGLEKLFNQEQFSFKKKNEIEEVKVNLKGHVLTEFQGEKISGALDFISKILELDKIAAIKSFIERIEVCNRKIQPLLAEELQVITIKLNNLNSDMAILRPQYLKLVEISQNYIRLKNEIQTQMIVAKEFDAQSIDPFKVNQAFISKFPQYVEFEKEFEKVARNHTILNERIDGFNKLFNNITAYNTKIISHFGR